MREENRTIRHGPKPSHLETTSWNREPLHCGCTTSQIAKTQSFSIISSPNNFHALFGKRKRSILPPLTLWIVLYNALYFIQHLTTSTLTDQIITWIWYLGWFHHAGNLVRFTVVMSRFFMLTHPSREDVLLMIFTYRETVWVFICQKTQ